ncbi:hypothetical protein PVK06_025482 [Gossypium arboreum]|uniref:Uncharacterized protein n=1 Tax=Gossypium arboreum TaxID=29729 RepID=A0ABR0PGZ0_GOSAR|nr:hypothetical protein PVK06_025482 [Gossypium arboreum]
MLAQPAANPLARPTTDVENNELIQNWLATKLAKQNPMRKRTRMKEVGEEIKAVAKTIGAVMRERAAEAIRGPTRSHTGPIARREKMEPMKAAVPAAPMSAAERLRFWRMIGMRGGIEKAEKKQENKESHAR